MLFYYIILFLLLCKLATNEVYKYRLVDHLAIESTSHTNDDRIALLMGSTIYDFKPLDAYGKVYDLAQLEGKVVVIVNVASLCGFTQQYKDLEYLYKKYNERGFIVLGFPCNQFGNQEPFTGQEILRLCEKKFGVTFPIMNKIEVNGDGEEPLYEYLKNEQKTPLGFKGIKWNFEKFLISRSGKVVKRFDSTVVPLSIEEKIIELLEDAH